MNKNIEIKKIEGMNEFKVVKDGGFWLAAGTQDYCKRFAETYKEPSESVPFEYSQKVGKIIDSCFVGEISRDEAINLIWKVK